MGQFKPMVKMMTTEPSVELKLAKGGAVKMKKGGSTTKAKKMADGGMSAMGMMAGTPALVGRPAVNAPVRAPMKPSMASRRKAMMAKKPMPATTPSGPSMAMPTMKKGGKAEGGESKKTHMAEMSKMKGLEKELKSHASKPASKGHKGLKTGGVINGQGGYKKGGGVSGDGIINTENQGGKYRNTMMHTAEYTGKSSGKTGGVKNGNGGGYKTGGVALGNGGGYKDGGMTMVEKGGKMVPDFAADGKGKMKHGGKAMMGGGMMGYKMGGKSSKKAYATGGTVDTGKPVAMTEGRKPVPAPVAISRLSGTYKSGGRATPAEARLLKNNKAENFMSMRDAKTDSNLKYGSPKRMKEGGTTDMSKGAYDKTGKYNRELEDAMNPLSMMKELAGKAKDYFMPKGSESVTKTKESVTVSPATKKRGGGAC
jgi:hypothetical protein